MSNTAIEPIRLHKLRKIEIVVHAQEHRVVEELMKAAGVPGWTMIRDVAGMGHAGFHQGKTIFNDESGLMMFVGVAEPVAIMELAKGLARLFTSRPGVTFLSDVEVLRSDYFAASDPQPR